MDITIPTKEHRAAIEAAADALRKSPGILPALTLVRIEAHTDGLITFEGTDLEFGIRAETRGEVRVAGILCLPGAQLAEIAAESDPESQTVIRTDGAAGVIEVGRSRYQLAASPAEEYLGNPDPTGGESVTLPGDSLRTMAGDVTWLVSKDENHGTLCGVLIETSETVLRLVASNGKQLALSETDVRGFTAGLSRIVPPQLLAKAERLLKGRGPVELSLAESSVGLRTAGLTLTARTLGGDYPPFANVLPRKPTTTIVGPTAALLQAVRRVAAVARGHEFKAILARAEHGHVRMWSRAPDVGTAKDFVDAVVGGKAVTVAFNALMMEDVLASVRSGDVRIRFHGPSGGILVDGRGSDPIRSLWLVAVVAQESLDCTEPPDADVTPIPVAEQMAAAA